VHVSVNLFAFSGLVVAVAVGDEKEVEAVEIVLYALLYVPAICFDAPGKLVESDGLVWTDAPVQRGTHEPEEILACFLYLFAGV